MSGSPLSRRGVLRVAGLGGVAALAAGALGGCDLDPDSSSTPAAVASPDPDQQVVLAARTELSGLIVRLSGTPGTARLIASHRQQLAALDGSPPAKARSSRRLTKAQVVAREHRAADRFTHWAAICQNGDLARVLASVAAGIQMQPLLREATQHASGPTAGAQS